MLRLRGTLHVGGSFCRYWKALYFWSLGISLYLELFLFLFFLFYVISASMPVKGIMLEVKIRCI